MHTDHQSPSCQQTAEVCNEGKDYAVCCPNSSDECYNQDGQAGNGAEACCPAGEGGMGAA